MIDPNRLHDRISLKRILLDTKRSVPSAVTLAVGVALFVAGAAWLVTAVSSTFGRSTYTARFAVRDVTRVVPGVDQVRYRGIIAGTITSIDRSGGQIILAATFRSAYGPIYRNAHAALRPETPLQDMYLDVVDPGTPSAGRLAPTSYLPAAQTDDSVNVDDVLDTLGGDERFHMQQLLTNLGNGLADRGQALRETFVQLAPLIEVAGRITGAVNRQRTETEQLVHNIGVLTDALANRNQTLQRLVIEGNATFGTLQQGSPDLNATLQQLPPTFSEIRSSLSTVSGVLGDVDTAVHRLYPVADQLPGALGSLRSLNAELSPALLKLRGPVSALVPFSTSLPPVAASLHGIAASLTPQESVINRTTLDLQRCESGVIGFFQWNASLTKFGDLRGPVPRGNLAFNFPDSGFPGVARRSPGANCVVGAPTIGGRPATAGDLH
jgi:phospholipid/cholesterol/gamma-HCH transport system substrate-binding protein